MEKPVPIFRTIYGDLSLCGEDASGVFFSKDVSTENLASPISRSLPWFDKPWINSWKFFPESISVDVDQAIINGFYHDRFYSERPVELNYEVVITLWYEEIKEDE